MSLIKNLLFSSLRFSSIVSRTNHYSFLTVGRARLPPISHTIQPFHSLQAVQDLRNPSLLSSAKALLPSLSLRIPEVHQSRTVTKWSRVKGKRKSVKAVVKRFYRLAWGAWIRPIVGRNKKHWSKNRKRKARAEKHVFCNATQSTLLDKMVTKYWRKRRFYVDDIYEPYHTRMEYSRTANKPQ